MEYYFLRKKGKIIYNGSNFEDMMKFIPKEYTQKEGYTLSTVTINGFDMDGNDAFILRVPNAGPLDYKNYTLKEKLRLHIKDLELLLEEKNHQINRRRIRGKLRKECSDLIQTESRRLPQSYCLL